MTMQKGRIIRWLKKEGDSIEKDNPLLEVEADKVTTEVESPVSGVLLKICVPEDTEVAVGQPIAFIGKIGEPLPSINVAAEGKATPEVETTSTGSREGPRTVEEEAEKVRASPLARALAKQHGLDLAQIRGTGPRGRITKEDILEFMELRMDTRAVKEIIPLKGIQKTIAGRMAESIRTAAHCSMTIEVDASRVIALRREMNAELQAKGEDGISFTDILVKVVATALKEDPILNSTLEGERLKVFRDVNIGIAVEVETEGASGLLVPVVREAHNKSLLQIAREARELIERARSGKVSHSDLSGGTFTITNLGMFGVQTFVPIINPPQTAILGVGAIIEKPAIVNGNIKPQPSLHLTLSFDHRVVNGARSARFMQRLKQILETEISEQT